MTRWILWAILLFAQNASFTLVSRARNSQSLSYHAAMSTLSNGIWFASQFILVENFLAVMREADLLLGVEIGLFYVTWTMIGSLCAHALALRLERRKATWKATSTIE